MSCRLLLISGSLRTGSTNTALLRTARAVAPENVETVLYEGLDELPHFNPDDDPDGGPVHPAVAALRRQIRGPTPFCSRPRSTRGALPGSFKNLLDWTVGGGETYGKPVGEGDQDLGDALAELGVGDQAVLKHCGPWHGNADARIPDQVDAGVAQDLARHVDESGTEAP